MYNGKVEKNDNVYDRRNDENKDQVANNNNNARKGNDTNRDD